MRDLSLRAFIEYLICKGELTVIEKEVSIKHEIAAYVRKSCDTNGPAFCFTNVKEFPGRRIVAGLYGSKRRMGLAIGFAQQKELSTKEALFEYIRCMDIKDDLPHVHETLPPCQEVVIDDPDLFRDVPIGTYCEFDKGPFVTSGIQVVKNTYEGKGKHELGIHRMFRVDSKHLTALIPWPRKIGIEHFKNSEKGIGTPISIFFGGDPIYTLASQAKVYKKYHFAGELARQHIAFASSLTSDILIPAECEFVIEGITVPGSCYDETPFGEYTSCYSFKSNAVLIKVLKITHRKDYIMPFYVTGRAPNEDINLCGPAVASHIYKDLQATGSDIRDVSCYIGNGVFSSNVSIKKRTNAEVRTLLHRMASSNYIKIGAVIDDDLDPNKEEDFRFALETRFRPQEDHFTTGLMTGASLDPSYEEQNCTGKLLLDLTIPIGKTPEETERNKQKHTRVRVPGEEEVTW